MNKCGIGLVPFEYFGSKESRGWFRMSIGGVNPDNVEEILFSLEKVVFKSLEEVNSWVM
jgi:aspartate/methionine/tyrosine aminotransferase